MKFMFWVLFRMNLKKFSSNRITTDLNEKKKNSKNMLIQIIWVHNFSNGRVRMIQCIQGVIQKHFANCMLVAYTRVCKIFMA